MGRRIGTEYVEGYEERMGEEVQGNEKWRNRGDGDVAASSMCTWQK